MQTFVYQRVEDVDTAIGILERDADAWPIAGGTELVNWMKEDICRPVRLVDINGLRGLDRIEADEHGLHIGALARMSDVAASPSVVREYPAIAEALLRSASPQLRNMASMGGNLLQRTRCTYFRAEVELPCNKRRAGSGCAARDGANRWAAIFGWSEHCVATHPSDVAVALVALDARVRLRGSHQRSVLLDEFLRLPGDAPQVDNLRQPGELIVGIDVPSSAMARRSWYLKVRERTSYEFALVSAAVALDLDPQRRIRGVQIALGGVAHKPWRLRPAEQALVGASIEDAHELGRRLTPAFDEARPLDQNRFKIELASRTVVRTLQLAGGRAA